MARTPDLQLHALWRERLRRQADGGLTIAQFCAQEGLSTATFHSWRRRLRLGELAGTLPAPPAPPAFLPVTVRLTERAHDEPLPIVADLPNGIRLRIPTSDTRLACRLVRAVARARTDSGGHR
jgi:transposase-like protein